MSSTLAGMPISATRDGPAMQPARQQQMADLAAEERHRVRGFDRNAHDRASGAIDAARQIDRDHRDAAGVHRLDHGARQRPRRRAARPAPNKASMMRSQSSSAAGVASSTGPCQRSAARAASPLQPRFVADQTDAHRKPASARMRAATNPSPPLLPGPATTDHPLALAHRGNPVGDRAPGIFHQLKAGNATSDRQPVGLGHLGGGEEFDHCGRHYRSRCRTPAN